MEFFRLSPRQYAALSDRHRQRLRREDIRTATVAHTVYSMLRTKRMPRRKVEDFMPRERAVLSDDDLLRKVESLNALLGGRDLRVVSGGR